jgi:hypothetical protein
MPTAMCSPSPAAQALTFVVERLYAETGEALNATLRARETSALNELELFEIVSAALEQVISRRQRALANGSVSSVSGGVAPQRTRITTRAGQPPR